MNKLWLSYLLLFSIEVIASLRSGAQTVNVGIVPPISTNLIGSSITLSATQDVQSLTFNYQWAKDGTNLVDGDKVSGSVTPNLTIANAQLLDAGTYRVSLSLTGVLQATAVSIVYVVDQPAIQSVVSTTTGGNINFTVNATGGLLTYQWTWQGQPIAGATNSALVFSNAYADASAGFYSVNVTNPLGSTNWSSSFLFTKPTPSGTYQGLFFDTNAVAPESSGFFQYTLSASKRSFSGKILIGANTYRFSGVFSIAHDSDFQVQRPNTTPLSVHMQLVTTNDSPLVIGSVTDGVWSSFLRGNRLYFTSRIPTALAGRYTLSLLNTNLDRLAPNGSGYGAVTIRSNGTVQLTGQAGDGTAISQNCGLSRSGDWPLYVSMFKGRGRLIGWLNVARHSTFSIAGDAVGWVKSPGPDKLYPDGFGVTLQPTGSSYVRTLPGLSFTNGVVALSGGDLFSDDVPIWDFVKVLVPRPNAFVAEQGAESLKLDVKGSTGVVSGQFIDLVTGLKTPIKGVVLQQQGYAGGYFISTNSSGSFTLTRGTTPR